MENQDFSKLLVITKQWLEAAECLNEDGSINIEKLKSLTAGQTYMIDEASFL
ncbi:MULTISPECIES: hypothetical protein [Bacillus]|uniref:Uncharacterized protein n=1 Tax=Bacillus thuringiensis TaxID=1428 RepID=A0AAW9GRE9_BACTU|nr:MULTISPECIES: hypothetical protein [Bacillus cereus group]MDY0854990.1 hypothetical protein [Bacillus thuringiensis]MDY4394876.1 hypothetical protein [Bacillus thuringiensis]GIX59457.1 hypothetical protein BPADB04_44870 [Bacillus paranthracis]